MFKVVIKLFEPAVHLDRVRKEQLADPFNHPDRYRLSLGLMEVLDGVPYCKESRKKDFYAFPDNFCPRYLGEYPAIILGLNGSELFGEDRFLQYDRTPVILPSVFNLPLPLIKKLRERD